jgi:hypothetical protein
MSLISRIEITNYLTEGLADSRRIMDWRPMLNGITLRLDNFSALINITNGGGKTSMADLILYVLSRDSRLLKRVREKCSPKERGYTHARIEFRETSHEAYAERNLFPIDPLNQPGETHVIGVAMTDKAEDTPIFYYYSGTLEDSPCYVRTAGQIQPVTDAQFSARTRAMPGCKWNKHTSRKEWEDQIALLISVEVVRRNVKYQVEGSDDKNAEFFTVKPRSGESDDRAFFRSVIAPDLLTNLLSTWAEENEDSIEDTLHLSLSQIVRTEETIARQENRLQVRQDQLDELAPLLEIGERATRAQLDAAAALLGVRKDAALIKHFGDPFGKTALPGLPRPLERLAPDPSQDPRVVQALKGMLISAEEPLMLIDKALSELTGVEVRQLNQTAERKRVKYHTPKSQVIDIACDFEKLSSGSTNGGHQRKAYTKDDAIALVPLLKDISGAKIAGLEAALALAFDIAEAQIDTNPGAIEERRLTHELQAASQAHAAAQEEIESVEGQAKRLEEQLTSRADNRAAWDEFQAIAHQLPEPMRANPLAAKQWLSDELAALNAANTARTRRQAVLEKEWATYQAMLAQAGLAGIDGVRSRFAELDAERAGLENSLKTLEACLREGRAAARTSSAALAQGRHALRAFEQKAERFAGDKPGYDRFISIFGEGDPREARPEQERDAAHAALADRTAELRAAQDECTELNRLHAQLAAYHQVFGEADPLTYDPVKQTTVAASDEADARERQARLVDKVEALDNFEGLFPGVGPGEWINNADAQFLKLSAEKETTLRQRSEAAAELAAISEMKVVDDADFSSAWRLLGERKVPAKRLFEALRDSAASDERKKSAMSALSGLLSAPVFQSWEELQEAAHMLCAENCFVPLIDGAALAVAIANGTESAGELHMVGFIAGQYSRRVRILLEPEFAEAELARLALLIQETDAALNGLELRLAAVSPYGEHYRLARLAGDAVREQARQQFEIFAGQIAQAQRRMILLAPQTTPVSLTLLQSAREFLDRGGDARRMVVEAERVRIAQDIALVLQPNFEKAAARASRENLNAVDAAVRFVDRGGVVAYSAAIADLASAQEAEVALVEAAENDAALVAQAEGTHERVESELAAFENSGRRDDLHRLQSALSLHERADDLSFLRRYEIEVQNASDTVDAIQSAQRVNFDRASTFKNNMSLSDQEVQDALTAAKARRGAAVETAAKLVKRMRQIEEAERPEWIATRRAIHELAYSVGRRMQRTRAFAADLQSAPHEEQFPAEAHPLFDKLAAVEQRAKRFDSSHELVQTVNALVLEVDALDFERARSELDQAKTAQLQAERSFETAKRLYCEKVRGESSVSETAFNALEIEEIERSTPSRLQALVDLFAKLKSSIEKDREAAVKSRDVATQAHDAALEHLGNLMQLAETNLKTLEKVMSRYPGGRFFVSAGIVAPERMREILLDLKHDVAQSHRESNNPKRVRARDSDSRTKQMLREALIDRIFVEPTVQFTNSGIWGGKKSPMTSKMSTGQKVALQFMWIIRQAEFEIERGLTDLSPAQATRSRTRANRMILIDGIFSSLSDRHLIKEAMNGLKDLGGNFQIVGLLHSTTWVNDESVFPVYHVGFKLGHSTGKSLVVFGEGRESGTLGVFSTFARTRPHEGAA